MAGDAAQIVGRFAGAEQHQSEDQKADQRGTEPGRVRHAAQASTAQGRLRACDLALSLAGLRLLHFGIAPQTRGAQCGDTIDRRLLLAAVIFGCFGPFGHDFGEERFRCHAADNAQTRRRFRPGQKLRGCRSPDQVERGGPET